VGALPEDLGSRLPVRDEAAVTIVLAAEGYPGDPRRGDAVSGIDDALARGALVFHAGTAAGQRPGSGFATNGGRVLAVSATGPDVATARVAAERAADAIAWTGMHRRRDIAATLPDRPAVLSPESPTPVPEPAR
jgi:phosphoribosylamine--glycine ligase